MKNMAPLQINTVNGQAAHTINNHGPIHFWQRAPRMPGRRIKELMPNACHAQLDWLLDNSDLIENDLVYACKSSALGCQNGKLVRQFVALDYSVGALLASYLFCWVAVFWMVLAFQPLTSVQNFWTSISLMVTACPIAWVVKQYFWSQFIARKAIRSLVDADQNVLPGCEK